MDEEMSAEEAAIASGAVPQPDNEPEPAPAPEPAAPEPAAAAPVAAPVPAEAPRPVEPPRADEPRVVPLAVHIEERKAHRDELQKITQRFEEVVRRLAPDPAPAAPATPALPDVDADPVANLKAINAELTRLQTREDERSRNQQTQADQQRQGQDLTARYVASAREFSQQNPDFGQAYQHFVNAREQVMIAAGYTDPVQRGHMLNQQEAEIVRNAIEAGVSPAERIYATAQAFSYRKPEPATAAPAAPAAMSASPAPAAGPAPVPTEADKLAAIRQGVDRGSKSLGNGSGSPTPKLDLKSLATMDDETFAATVSDKDFKALMRTHYQGA